MKVKICGLTTADQVKTCIKHDANFCGFILNYRKSHRFIKFEKAKKLTKIKKKNKSEAQNTKDCFEKLNRATFAFNQGLDKALIKPIAEGYRKLPDNVQKGTSNAVRKAILDPHERKKSEKAIAAA